MIQAQVIADSVWNGKRLTSLQLVLPRFILAQLNTHRAFSRSTASSRAIPTTKLIEMVETDPVVPLHWGRNQPGMQAESELTPSERLVAEVAWRTALDAAVASAEVMTETGVHKQVVNRILEPFLWAHTIVTATEWDNFFALRLDDAAQPEIQRLAQCMKQAMDDSTPAERQFHLPYITDSELETLGAGLTTRGAYRYLAPISAARCARVSYLNHDQSEPDLGKDKALAEKLRAAGHMSPFEHQAFAPNAIAAHNPDQRNFQGWVQFRSNLDK